MGDLEYELKMNHPELFASERAKGVPSQCSTCDWYLRHDLPGPIVKEFCLYRPGKAKNIESRSDLPCHQYELRLPVCEEEKGS